MNMSLMDIERVVREVIAELGIAASDLPDNASACVSGAAAPPPVALPVAAAVAIPTRCVPVTDALVISSRLVTMVEVADRLAAARRVVVARGAVVTPAVRDELLRRGIALQYGDATAERPVAAMRLVMIATSTDFDPAKLATALTREGVTVEHSTSACILASTDQLASEVAKGDTLGVLLTRHTAAGLCLANRLAGVRAITACNVPAVAAAASGIGANLLVADPQAGTFFQLKQMLTEFCRGGIRPCPNVFRARLA